jgi:hypothetical protein
MPGSSHELHDPLAQGHRHGKLQKRVAIGAAIVALVVVLVSIPLMTDPELRLDVFRWAGLVPQGEGEVVADEDSGATLIVLPTSHQIEGTGRPQVRFLAAFMTWPGEDGMRLHPLNGGDDVTVPLTSYELVSSSPKGSQMFMAGPEGGVLIDVPEAQVIATLAPGEAPDVDWDWRIATWQQQTYICDRISITQAWIGCFERPELATWFAGDWQLNLERYGPSEETHAVMRGLGFQPIIGFTADDAWLYIYNERGIRRFDVAEVTGP